MQEKIYEEWNKPDDISINAEDYDRKCQNLETYERAIDWIREALENEDYYEIERILEGLEDELW